MKQINLVHKATSSCIQIVVCLAMVCTLILPYSGSTVVQAAEGDGEYDRVFRGYQSSPITLSSGNYLFDNVSVNGNGNSPAAVNINGDVQITFKGTSNINGQNAYWNKDKQYESGPGIQVEVVNGYQNKVTMIGDAGVVVNVKGGNANPGQNGENGQNGQGADRRKGGVGGAGGNGASAAIGGRGGIGGGNSAYYKGKDCGKVTILGKLKLNTNGGSGGVGGNGGSGGWSDGDYKVLWINLSAGAGGGGGGGGGYPGAGIGGGGAAGDFGGHGGHGYNFQNTSISAYAVSGGAGGGGGRGWGAGGGGGTGLFAYYLGQLKYYHVNASGGKGGKSPTQYGEGGYTAVYEASLPGSGHDYYSSILRVGSYSGDAVSVDDAEAAQDGYIHTAWAGNYQTSQRRNGVQFGGKAGRNCQETSDWGGYGLDTAYTFYKQGGGETPEASTGHGEGRRYELWVTDAEATDGARGEKSFPGKGGVIEKSEGTTLNPGSGGTGSGSGADVNPGENPTPIETVIDLSLPGTKVIFNPVSDVYDGKEKNPSVQIVSSTGIMVDPGAYKTLSTGDQRGPGDVSYVFTGKGREYDKQYVINSTSAIFHIEKGIRTTYIEEKLNQYAKPMYSSFNLGLKNYEDDGNTVEWVVEKVGDNPDFEYQITDNGKNGMTIKSINGTGQVKVKVNITEGNHYFAYTTEEVTLTVSPAGAESFTLSPIDDQPYTGSEIKPNFTVNYGDKTLVEGKDYEFKYENNVEIGRAGIVVVGKGDYEGNVNGYFNIIPADISPIRFGNGDYGVNPPRLPNLTYTGFTQTSIPVNGILNGKNMVEGKDYLITYSNLSEVGKVVVTIVGIGNYTGSTTLEYDIVPTDIDKIGGMIVTAPDSVQYDKTMKTPKPTVSFNGRTLEEGKDYTLSYENNVKAGTATVIIHGKGNFTTDSQVKSNFTITQRPIYVVPESNQNKVSGDKDPDKIAYHVDNIVAGDTVTFIEDTKLGREEGESVGEYPINLGNLALDYGHYDNDNYLLYMTPDKVNYSVKAYNTDAVAIIRGEIIDKETKERAKVNKDTGWYNHYVEVVAPEGYLISPSCILDNEDTKPEDSAWKSYFTSTDGDFSETKGGLTYYLMKIPEKAGQTAHISQPKQVFFKQDTVKPSGRIEMNQKKIYIEFKEKLNFELFFNVDVLMELFGSDETSGVDSNSYYMATREMTKEELGKLTASDWKNGSDKDSFRLELKEETKNILYQRVVDVAGNITYINSDGFIIDKTKPEIILDYTPEGKWVANKNAKVDVHVNETLSGIDERYMDYHYEYIKGGESDPYIIKLDKDGNAVLTDLADGDYEIIVSAKDKAGNTQSTKKHVMIDTIKPLLEVTGNLTDYAPFKDVDIKASVGPSGVEHAYVQRQEFGVACDPDGTWIEITDDYNSDKSYRVNDNGTYYFKYENGAKVESNIATISFDTIDHEVPVVNVHAISVSDKQTYHGAWTKDNVKVFFNNVTNNKGTTKYMYRLKKEADTQWGDWQSTSMSNDKDASILLSQSGVIEIQMKLQSAAGLESGIMKFTVRIDKIMPTGEVSLVDRKWNDIIKDQTFNIFYNSQQSFVIAGMDSLSGVQTIQYKLMANEDAKKAYTLEDLEGMNDWTLDTHSLDNRVSVPITPNNSYVVYTKITDVVGNTRYLSSDGAIVDDAQPELIIDKSEMKDYHYPIGSDGLWITNAFATLPVTFRDALSGVDRLETSYTLQGETKKKTYGLENDDFTITQLEEGTYDLFVVGYDKAGNMASEILTIRKDSVEPSAHLKADNVNFGSKKHVDIEPIVGSSQLKSLGWQFVPTGSVFDKNGTWHDIKADYGQGVDIVQNGTFYVRVENNLGISNIVSLEFANIKEVPASILVDTVNEDGQLVVENANGWLPAIQVRFYNDPKNVSDFTYEYHTGDGAWKEVTPEDGYAYIKALEGTTTYHLKITNMATTSSSEESITVHVDTTKPIGEITTSVENSRIWKDATTKRTIDYGLHEPGIVTLENVSDAPGSSGLHSVQYYVMTAGKNTQLKDFPATEKEVKEQLDNKWIPMNASQMKTLVTSGRVILDTLNEDQEYMVYVKLKDVAGNVQYITSDGMTIDTTKPVITTDYKDKSWITKTDQNINVTVKDNLSGINTGSYSITNTAGSNTFHYNCEDRDGKFIIPGAQLAEGVNTLTIKATDVASNVAEDYVVIVLKDTVKPIIHLSNGNNSTHRVGVNIDQIGKSAVDKIYVTCDNGAFDTKDITTSHTEGIQIPRNGKYTFVLVNKAGISSDPVTLQVDDLSEPPVALVTGTTTNGEIYDEGTWSNSEVKMKVNVQDIMVGKGVYEYSLDKGKTWTTILPDSEDVYWITQSDNGEYHYQFRVTAPDGAMSDIVSYDVKIDTTIPNFTYTITPKENTNKWVDITIIPDVNNPTLEYSFDGGETYSKTQQRRFISNGYVQLALRNATGTVAKKTTEIETIDRLSPTMMVFQNRVTEDGVYTVEMEVDDSPANLDFMKSGVKEVFITDQNPYSETNVRTEALPTDYKLVLQDNQHYGTYGEFKANENGNKMDNFWIIATDNVGNYKINSFRIDPKSGNAVEEPEEPTKPEEPEKPSNPDKPNENEVGKVIEEIEKIDKDIKQSDQDSSVDLLIEREDMINQLIDEKIPQLGNDDKTKKEIVDVLSKMNLSNEQRKQLENEQRVLEQKERIYIYLWIPFILLMLISYLYYRYKKNRLEKCYADEKQTK